MFKLESILKTKIYLEIAAMFDSFTGKLLQITIVGIILTGCTGTASNSDNVSNSLPTAKGTATLNWLPPTENNDDTILTDLTGYVIYYGTSPESLINRIQVSTPGVASFVVENLDIDTTYYFSITAVNSNEIQSNYSNIVSKHISS